MLMFLSLVVRKMKSRSIANQLDSCLHINNMVSCFTALRIKDELNLAHAAAFNNAQHSNSIPSNYYVCVDHVVFDTFADSLTH